jgi:hypothetical protein
VNTTILSQEAAEALAIALTIEDRWKSYRRMVQIAIYMAAMAVVLMVASVLI